MPDTIDDKLKSAPLGPGVYLIRDAAGQPIYIGKAESLRKRLQQHFRESDRSGPWHEVMLRHAVDFDYVLTRSPVEALLLEATLIKQHRPRFNIRLTDDKSFPYLMLTEETFPRLTLLRDLPAQARPGGRGRPVARGLHDPKQHRVHRLDEGELFGPFTDARAMRRTSHFMSGLFGLRTCRQPLSGKPVGKPCLNRHLGRCLGPCTGEVSAEAYHHAVRQVQRFLRGQSGDVEADLRSQMEAASTRLDFERAATLRDQLQSLQRAMRDQVVVSTRAVEQDVAAGAAAEDTAVVALLRIRHGRLIGHEEYPLHAVRQHSPVEMLEAFLTQHYSQAQWAPREVLLSEIEDPAAWEALLTGLRGSGVSVRRPERGAGRRLMDLARQNAEAALLRALQNRQRREGALGALEDLRDLVGLEHLPERVEGYDISNVQGDHATASMVVFSMGQPDKQAYRRFKIRTPGPDDYAMLAEALTRRLQRLAEEDPKFLPAPDLILVDGGVGQVSAARRVLEAAGRTDIALLGLAKQEEQVFLSGQENPLPAPEHPSAWYLLQRVRDESHRFARSYHLGLRDAAMTRSELDAVPGLGPTRRKSLMRTFPSLTEMAKASVEELAAAPGMNRPVAQALKDHLAARDAPK